MELSFRWHGEDSNISLEDINQIPCIEGIVSAVFDVPIGKPWPLEKIIKLKDKIETFGLSFTAIESLPVHESIKMGKKSRDKYIDNYRESLKNIGKANVNVVTYDFMPIFDWVRSQLNYKLPDGSYTLIYEDDKIKNSDPLQGDLELPDWEITYNKEELKSLIEEYKEITCEDMWDNLSYFINNIIDVAEEYNIKLAIHPDDPPWSIFGLPRIIKNKDSLDKVIKIKDSPSNGIALCTGSLGSNPNNNIPEIIKHFGKKNKINFVHARNIKHIGPKSFIETSHMSKEGTQDMYKILKALDNVNFSGPLRPDHGRNIWNENPENPGYGLYDRALGASYLSGLWEVIQYQ